MAVDELTDPAASAAEALRDLETVVAGLNDADLHRAHPDGGWTCAQIVSHIQISGLLWVAALERLRHRPGMFMYREELGHDVVGATPHSAAEAAGRLASVRTALEECVPAADPSVVDKELDVPPFGRFRVGAGLPGLAGHLVAHCGQVKEILRSRGLLGEPAGSQAPA
jgi:hypothetical protein